MIEYSNLDQNTEGYMVYFSGTLELNLNGMAAPAKKARNCKLSQLPDIGTGAKVKTVSLFEQKRIRGFWPCYNDETGERVLTVSRTCENTSSSAVKIKMLASLTHTVCLVIVCINPADKNVKMFEKA